MSEHAKLIELQRKREKDMIKLINRQILDEQLEQQKEIIRVHSEENFKERAVIDELVRLEKEKE